MTQKIFVTSPSGAPSKSVTYVVDATAGNETVTVPLATTTQSNGWPEYERVAVIKTDGSANTVTVQDAAAASLGVLETQGDSMTVFCDGLTWKVIDTSSAADASSVAASLSTHAALTTAHGSVGVVMGATTVDAKDVAAVLTPVVTEILDPFGHRVVQFPAGGALAVNYWRMFNAVAGANPEMIANGTNTDIGFEFTPKGAGNFELNTGKFIEAGTDVAINSGAAQVDSTAILLATLVTDFNLLLAKLRTARVLNP